MNIVFWLVGTLIVVLGPIVLIHELAHFAFAKLAGVRVEEFGFGFPPRLLKLWRGKGYLDINAARVIIPWNFHLPSELETGDQVDAVVRKRDDGTYLLRRLTVLDADTQIDREERQSGELHFRGELTTLERGTLYSLNILPMGAFVRMTGEEDPSDPLSLAAQPRGWRLAVLGAGPVLNLIVALMLLVGAYASGMPTQWQVKIAGVESGTAADEAGLQAGDVILSADGEPVDEGLEELQDIIRGALEQPVDIVVSRGDEKVHLTAVPQPPPEEYDLPKDIGFLGIRMTAWPDRNTLKYYSPPAALRTSISDFVQIARRTLSLPAQLIRGDVSSRKARPVSMVGIGQVMTLSLQQSVEWRMAAPALQTASLISLALGLTNLLPLPGLDGGRMLFVLVEAVRGRRVPPEREAMIHFVGMVILASLMLLVMFQDFFNPVLPWSLLK